MSPKYRTYEKKDLPGFLPGVFLVFTFGVLRNFGSKNQRRKTVKIHKNFERLLKEAERQLIDSSIYKKVKVTEKDLAELVDKNQKSLLTWKGEKLFRRGIKIILNLVLKKLPMLESYS